MNAAEMMETCPDSETLAAFSDGALDEKMRLEVMEHVADCGQCQHELVELDAAKRELELEPANVTRGPFGGRWIAPLAAAAAVVVVLFGVPSIREQILGNSMGDLVEVANTLQERPTLARLSGDFVYKAHRRMRGTGDAKEIAQLQVDAAALDAVVRAEKNPSATNLHAAGVANLLTKNRQEAVPTLQAAVDRGQPSAALLSDLAAAYLERGLPGDAKSALDIATRAWMLEQTPAAAWNVALALEDLDRDAEAIVAWQKYLTVDPHSPWATEAKRKLQTLKDLQQLRRP